MGGGPLPEAADGRNPWKEFSIDAPKWTPIHYDPYCKDSYMGPRIIEHAHFVVHAPSEVHRRGLNYYQDHGPNTAVGYYASKDENDTGKYSLKQIS